MKSPQAKIASRCGNQGLTKVYIIYVFHNSVLRFIFHYTILVSKVFIHAILV
jgi:hypothetical protein